MPPRLTLPLIVGVSFVLTALTITNALVLKKQFYPAVVYITKNNVSLAVMYTQGAVLAYLMFSFVRYVFFGQLSAAEVEHATDRVWHAIMETCLAFAVFRDDFSPRFVCQFVILFFVKAFHWLAEDRVDYMERSPLLTFTFHARILGISALLSGINSHFISSAYFYTVSKGASAQLVFGFEYAVLMTMVLHIVIKYMLHTHDLQQNHPWENKAVYMLYAELFINFLRCLIYLAFFLIMMKIHTFPLFAIRQCYLTVRSFQKALNDVIQSRRATHAMNNLFPLATAEELAQGDATCIICWEEMTIESGAKKLPCNHIFHPNCLRLWFQRQQNCPTCRTDVLAQRRPNVIPGQNNGNNAAQANGVPPNAGVNAEAQAMGAGGQAIPPVFRRFLADMRQQQPQGQPNQQGGNGEGAAQPAPQLFPFMAHNFAFIPPHPPAQPAAATQQDQQNQQTGTNQPTAQSQAMPMPPFPGMFPFPPMAAPYRFPRPPVFAGLSNDEISQMEGTDRAAVEARLQALQNISTLLDAAALQFQQYLSVVNMLGIPPPTFTPAQNEPARATDVETPNSSDNIDTTVNNDPEPGPSTSSLPASNAEQPGPSSKRPVVNERLVVTENTSANGTTSAADTSVDNDTDRLEEIRRRRTQFFDGNRD